MTRLRFQNSCRLDVFFLCVWNTWSDLIVVFFDCDLRFHRVFQEILNWTIQWKLCKISGNTVIYTCSVDVYHWYNQNSPNVNRTITLSVIKWFNNSKVLCSMHEHQDSYHLDSRHFEYISNFRDDICRPLPSWSTNLP